MSTISVDRDARVLTVTINKPPHNFLTTAMMAELREALTSVEHDPTIGAVVLTSALDGVFITHADVSEILGGSDDFSVAISPAVARGLLRTQGQSSAFRVSARRSRSPRPPASRCCCTSTRPAH
jgi:enoyl-CoA hydratase